MSPYYERDGITIYHGDAREVLSSVPRGDLMVADPPYDLWADLHELFFDHGEQAIAAFCSWQHRQAIESHHGRPRAELVWHHDSGRWVSHNLPRLSHTSILIYGDRIGEAYVGEHIADRTPRRRSTGAVGRDRLVSSVYTPRARRLLESVISAPRALSGGVWAKPLAVVTPLIEWLCPAEGLVIDPCMGTGTTLRAAATLGRRAIGVELQERFCEIAARRLAQEVLV